MPKKVNTGIKCDVCGYCNKAHYVKQSGVCHLCGKVLDEKAYFKYQLFKKMYWRGSKWKNYK